MLYCGGKRKMTQRGRVVPMHPEIQQGTLKGILKQAGIDLAGFLDVL